jgi:hypothetical protein
LAVVAVVAVACTTLVKLVVLVVVAPVQLVVQELLGRAITVETETHRLKLVVVVEKPLQV